uniref:Optic atrophy 3 protein homolog n=1 Tax=Lepeophtheirus salmonis TaxID=72036 RepID=C1BV63_LEPSM|nr:Optic atrophy 3 protein homolog [Lepeophtheirus salmonis]
MMVGSYSSTSSSQPFPLSKLIFTFVQRIAAPISSRILIKAEKSPSFKRYFVLPPARTYYFYEAKIKYPVLLMFNSKKTNVPRMCEKKQLDLGSRLLAESLLMFVASIFAFNEYYKSKKCDVEDEYIEFLKESGHRINRIVLHSPDIDRLNNELLSIMSGTLS